MKRRSIVPSLGIMATLTLGLPQFAYADVARVQPDPAKGDGVYGRFDGDVDLGVGVGARVGEEGAGPALRVTAHYLYSAGIFIEAALPMTDAANAAWTGAAGIDLRPLFLPRWALGFQRGPAFLDLLLDSVSIGGAAYVQEPNVDLQQRVWGIQGDVGVAIPLLAAAKGLWMDLRANARWPLQGAEGGASLGAVVLLSWHSPWLSPVLR